MLMVLSFVCESRNSSNSTRVNRSQRQSLPFKHRCHLWSLLTAKTLALKWQIYWIWIRFEKNSAGQKAGCSLAWFWGPHRTLCPLPVGSGTNWKLQLWMLHVRSWPLTAQQSQSLLFAFPRPPRIQNKVPLCATEKGFVLNNTCEVIRLTMPQSQTGHAPIEAVGQRPCKCRPNPDPDAWAVSEAELSSSAWWNTFKDGTFMNSSSPTDNLQILGVGHWFHK